MCMTMPIYVTPRYSPTPSFGSVVCVIVKGSLHPPYSPVGVGPTRPHPRTHIVGPVLALTATRTQNEREDTSGISVELKPRIKKVELQHA